MLKQIAIPMILFMFCFSFCFSENIEIGLNDITVIQDATGLARILCRVDIADIPETSTIDFAELYIPGFLQQGLDIRFTLEAKRVTTQWNTNSVSWYYPWANPGGDFDTTDCCLFTSDAIEVRETYLDITPIIQSVVEGEDNYGIILKRSAFEGGGFTQYNSELYEKLREARLTVLYHNDN